MNLRPKRSLALIITALSSPQLFAEEVPELSTVVVTGRRVESRLEDTPQRIEVIDKTDIERTASHELTDLLKKNSSVDVIQYPGNSSGIGIRGFRPEYSGINKHSLLLIDGRPAMATNLSLVNTDQIERIEVLKGPASALYGSSAMGGVVNIITRENRGALKGFGQLSYGQFDTQEVKGAVGGAINRTLDFDYSGSFFRQGDDFRMGNGQERPNTSYQQQNHALRLGLNLSDDWRLNLKSDIYRGRDIATPGSLADGSNSQSNKDMDRDGTDLSLKGKLGNHQLNMRWFTGSQSYTLFKKTSTTAADRPYLPFPTYDEDITWSGWQLQDAWAWSQNASLVFGVDQEEANSTTRSYDRYGNRKAPSSANNKRESLGVYAENTWYLNEGNTTLHIGVRQDRITTRTKTTPFLTTFTPGTAEFTTTNPSAGFKHLLGAGFRLHGTVGTAFVPPGASELTGTAVTVKAGRDDVLNGNPNLRPESSTTWDLGTEWSSGNLYADLTFFSTKVKDKVVRTQVGQDANNNYFSYVNASNATMQGLEWETRWRPNSTFRLSLSGTHYLHREEEISGQTLPIRNVPRNTVRAAIDAEHGPWSGRIGLRTVGRWVDNDWAGDSSKYIEYASFTTMDIYGRYSMDKHQSVFVTVENIGDRFYSEKGGYPLAGRNARIGYRYDF